jgi:CheY-like chemotaxis protein
MTDPHFTSLQGLRVLVVEDEALVSMLLEDMLADLGCEVVAVCSRVSQAAEAAADTSRELDVAILDVNVAGEPVTPVAEALAARGVPFVFATGYGAGGQPESFRDRPTLQKPFGMSEVEARLLEAAGR